MPMAPVSPLIVPLAPPTHVAIIMDGNGRWAKARGLPRTAGHKRGAEAVRRTVECAREMGVRYLTLYAFSSENWKRPVAEVSDLMGLLRWYLRSEIANLNKNNVRLRVIGDRSRLGRDIVALIEEGEEKTGANEALTLVLALSYGSRQEIAGAARALALDVAAGRLRADEIDEAALTRRLFTAGMPDPDLIIRTSGELRLSNFLLWQAAYSELVFLDVLWPEFGQAEFAAAIGDYQRRERRFGATAAEPVQC
jgi:undecaprenyl diphosphate synthase